MQRPGAPRQIEADLSLLYQAARLAKERVRALDFIDARALVDEFARSIRQELDYRHEARNAERFRRTSPAIPHVRVPRVYWSYTRSRVLTLEFLDGTQLADVAIAELDRRAAPPARRLITEAWMTMIFRHGFFHGDPHPANILVLGRPGRSGSSTSAWSGKLTEDDMSKATRPLHRRRERERRRPAEAAGRPRRPLSEGARGASSPPSSASSTTATTGRASPRSTRSR